MRNIVLIGAICLMIVSCGNRKAISSDGDPSFSGPTEHIGAIMKSIADGDAKTLASLTSFPIGRKYPLHNITSAADMINRFDQVFDKSFRDRMKTSKASDWQSFGWRGYGYGDKNVLWVYDSLTIINYYSPQEKDLYRQLMKREMASLHESLRGKGWYPMCCYRNKRDRSIVRVDFHLKEEMKDVPYFTSGEEEFRLCVYPEGSSLSGKPKIVSKGHAESSGSAHMTDYSFKSGNIVIVFGDSYYEDGKPHLVIKSGNQETRDEITPCYWLDLLNEIID